MAAFPWRWAVLCGGLLVIGAGLMVAWRGARWPVMSSRYDQPASRKTAGPADPASLWESLSQGLDPTAAAPPVSGNAQPGLAESGNPSSGHADPGTSAAGPDTASAGSGTAPGGRGTGRNAAPG
jgi:hypothetical protein